MDKKKTRKRTVHVISDLHIEFAENYRWLLNSYKIQKGDILIIAGDFCYLDKIIDENNHDYDKAIEYLESMFNLVVVIPGNHEYYSGCDVNTLEAEGKLWITDKTLFLNNRTLVVGNYKFILSTLWSKILNSRANDVKRGLNDFRRIKDGEEYLSIEKYNKLNEESIKFIEGELFVSDERKRVVITHHAPSYSCMDPIYMDSKINNAFYNHLDYLLEEADIEMWCYGHTHDIFDKKIGNTRVVSNVLGYVFMDDKRDYLSLDPILEFEETIEHDILNDFTTVNSQKQFDEYEEIMMDMWRSHYPSEISIECEYLWKLILPWLEKIDTRFESKQKNKVLDLFPKLGYPKDMYSKYLCWYRSVESIIEEVVRFITDENVIENLEMIYSKETIWDFAVATQGPYTSSESAMFLANRYHKDPNEFDIYRVIQKQIKDEKTRS